MIRAHVRDRSNPRSGRHGEPRCGGADGRGPAHRGPDDALRRIGPPALAHTRLAIIDVAGGDQPLDSEDGQVTAIVNGEIYNQRQLRERLEERGHRFATHSDSEVVVHRTRSTASTAFAT